MTRFSRLHSFISPPDAAPGSPDERCVVVRRVTMWGLVWNLVLCALKAVLGIIGHSQALVADAVHSLSDTVTDLTVLVGAPIWSAPPDKDHPHGHGRIEIAVSVFIGIALAVVGMGLMWRALTTLHLVEQNVPGWLAFWGALISLVVKEGLYRYTAAHARRIRSSALMANAWHHRSDALSSIPVAMAVVGSQIRPDWVYLDHVATIIVGVFILKAAWSIAIPAVSDLMDAGVSEAERARILRSAGQHPEVREVHGLRTRHIGSGVQVDLHVLVDPKMTVEEGHQVSGKVKRHLLQDVENVADVLVHLEPCHRVGDYPQSEKGALVGKQK